MPLVETRDELRARLRWTAVPPLTLAETMQRVEATLSEGLWQFAIVMDLRVTHLSLEDSGFLFRYLAGLTRDAGPHGPIALVACDADAVATLVRSSGSDALVELFWDIESAEQWIERIAAKWQP